jgi:hypothetical protein
MSIGRHVPSFSREEWGDGGPIAGPGQSVHAIDLPKELENVTDADELSHLGLKK